MRNTQFPPIVCSTRCTKALVADLKTYFEWAAVDYTL